MKKSKQEIKNRILSFTKKRLPDSPVSTSEITRDLFSDVWKNHLDEVKSKASDFKNRKISKDHTKSSIGLTLLKSSE